jgi:hypothetical protein
MDHECPRPPCSKKNGRPSTKAGAVRALWPEIQQALKTDRRLSRFRDLYRSGMPSAASQASSRCMCVGFGSSKPKPPKCLHQLGANRPRKPTLGWKTTGPLPTPVQYREILSRTCDPERDAPVPSSTTRNSKKRNCCKERTPWPKERLWSTPNRSATPGQRSVTAYICRYREREASESRWSRASSLSTFEAAAGRSSASTRTQSTGPSAI